MNKLSRERRAQILGIMVEGNSIRSIVRMAGVGKNTVIRLLQDAGEAFIDYHDRNVRGVAARHVQCDEIWSFIGVKAKNRDKSKRAADPTAGDVWTWVALDADTKLAISYLVGGRDSEYAMALMDDLRRRVTTRLQLTTDGHAPYLQAVEEAFGADIDYAMLVKLYGEPSAAPEAARRYSPSGNVTLAVPTARCMMVGTRCERVSADTGSW